MISDETHKIIMDNADALNSAIIYDRDFGYVSGGEASNPESGLRTVIPQNYFGYKTLERSYLLRINGKVAERPQHLLMRVAVGIHGSNIEKAIESYNLVSIVAALLAHFVPDDSPCRCPSDTSRMPRRPFLQQVHRILRCRRVSWSP